MKTEQEWIEPLAEALNKDMYGIGKPFGERTQALIRAIQQNAKKHGYTEAIEAAHPVGIRCGTSPMGDAYNKGVNDAIAAIETALDRLDQDTKQ